MNVKYMQQTNCKKVSINNPKHGSDYVAKVSKMYLFNEFPFYNDHPYNMA